MPPYVEPTRDSLLKGKDGESAGEQTKYTPDDVLEKMGSSNHFLLLIIFTSSFAWAITSFTWMPAAFIADACTTENCTNEMVTLVEEFDLRGSRAYLSEMTSTTFMIGNLFGVIISFASDRFGRRPLLILCSLGMSLCSFVVALSPNLEILFFARILQGMFYTGTGLVGWVYGYESSPCQLRKITTWVFGFTWAFGYCMVAPVVYYSPTWRVCLFFIAIPPLLYAVFCYFFIPESLHYLCTKDNVERKELWLEKARKSNGEDCFINKLQADDVAHKKDEEQEKQLSTFRQLWNHKIFIFYLAVLVILWTCDNFIYFGLSLYSTQLAGNKYWNFVLIGIIEVPAYMAAPPMLDRLGRRFVTGSTHILAGTAFFILFFYSKNPLLNLFLWLTGKFAITCAYMALFVYSSEIFPTDIRNVCIGTCDFLGRVGCFLAPYLGALDTIYPSLPSLVLAVFSMTSGLITFMLPETLNRPLPHNIRTSCEK